VWIEATVPGEGVGVDSVPTLMKHSGHEPIPEEKIILRFTNAISEKQKKLIQYQQNGIVQPDDAFLVGICGSGISAISYDASDVPAIIKSVYPIGEHRIIFNTKRMEIVEERYESRYEIHKDSGSPVSTSAFIDPSYSGISGILYANTSMINLPTDPNNDFLFVNNLLASVPLDKGWVKTGIEWWFDRDGLSIIQN
jgi:hypothetical protein